ncbi:outer membrane efflux protein [Leptospira broomii serovar Hurstbridge str. 5399]|uniref:Outer membrane efflux protein n=1 Tax=Leptospira broomii serovar Hurstbridge str. 5399 TaxID=1049789 RepID=T0F857_9LEPT|nr:TolC family protein [Leptospira broomii]EQA43682.1 outer membrane efflux protein [Leptospira broomii serovar Hurstbridge str. 5399]
MGKFRRKYSLILNLLIILILFYQLLSARVIAAPSKEDENLKITLTLEQAVMIGTTNSVILRTLEAKKEIFKMLITERWREFLPKVGVQYFGLRNINVGSADNIYNDVRLTVQQLVFDGGEASLNLETSKLNEVLNEKDFKINYAKLKLEIQKAYFKTLGAKGKVFLARKTLEKMEESYSKSQAEYKQGFIPKIQLIETASRLRQAQYSLQKYKNEYGQSLLELKQILNLDYQLQLNLEENLFTDFILAPPRLDVMNVIARAREEREDVKKSRVVIQRLKDEKTIAENYWIPKLYVGGYAGRNGDRLPLQHDIYGVNFNLTFPLGSNTVQTNGNLGVQKDGTGIQTYPGFGNQFVGPGLNGYNSSQIKFWDNLSYARKIVEGEVQLSEAILNRKSLENQIGLEVQKSADKLLESWEIIKIANSKVLLQWESLKIASTKYRVGQAKREDMLAAESEYVKSQEELTDALSIYATGCYELAFTGTIEGEINKLIQYKKGKGNSLISALLNNEHIDDIFLPDDIKGKSIQGLIED